MPLAAAALALPVPLMTPVLVMVLAAIEVRQTGLAAAILAREAGTRQSGPWSHSRSRRRSYGSRRIWTSPLVVTGVASGASVFGCIASA